MTKIAEISNETPTKEVLIVGKTYTTPSGVEFVFTGYDEYGFTTYALKKEQDSDSQLS